MLKGGDGGPAAVAGRPRASLIVEAVEQGGELKMPPQGKLSAGEIDRLRRWNDLHATILHLLGLDHEKLTYRHSGRDYRLTDVYGNVVRSILL